MLDNSNNGVYEDDGYSLYSEDYLKQNLWKLKLLYTLAALVTIPLVWYMLFYLPNSIPEAIGMPLDIAKVGSIPVYLHPIEPKLKKLKLQEWYEQRLTEENVGEIKDINEYKFSDIEGLIDSSSIEEKVALRRLILVGDVHGSYRELAKLMKKMKINHRKDYVILLGDFISKGPDSSAVLNWAVSNRVGCVLGNHEVYILNRYAQFHSMRKPEFVSNSTSAENDFTSKEFYDLDDEMKIAKSLRPELVEYLINCPLISELGPVAHLSSDGATYKDKVGVEGIAVHAGLLWNIEDLQDQDPETVVSIRSLLLPDFTIPTDDPHIPGAENWQKHWNKHQKRSIGSRRKVFYGHNARKGLDIRQYSTGLDTGCVTGGELSAVEIWAEVKKNKLVYRQAFHKTSCE